ncbi:unnamed protein product [Candidula unifasciata]|uniref:Uncharacterized protein n=1 Tax=Candidula unifasciata TaxID=100452 RepID=A0A8S3YZ27_9EUPU|nr:unnamed protein product [Candidula unifasciata]
MATSISYASGSDLDSDAENNRTLPECFDFVFKLHEEFETTSEPTSSDHLQKQLREGILLCEKAIRIVNDLQLFSNNEDFEEVSTNEIKYMLLSAFLAYLTGLNTHLPRSVAVNKSKLCYLDFLKLLKSYDVIQYDVHHSEDDEEENTMSLVKRPSSQNSDLSLQAAQRNNKIQRFKEKKAMEKKMTDLKVYMDKEHVDDEIKREFYLTLLKHWASKAVDEIDSCNLELQMLKHREEMARNGQGSQLNVSRNNETKKVKSFRPFILTKTQIQKQVFGLGYPSMPTMTVDEFYEQKLKEGTLSESVHTGHSMQNWAQNPEQDALEIEKEDAEKELKAERDDEEALARARAMDDWKDDHRRGEGNRYNKG